MLRAAHRRGSWPLGRRPAAARARPRAALARAPSAEPTSPLSPPTQTHLFCDIPAPPKRATHIRSPVLLTGACTRAHKPPKPSTTPHAPQMPGPRAAAALVCAPRVRARTWRFSSSRSAPPPPARRPQAPPAFVCLVTITEKKTKTCSLSLSTSNAPRRDVLEHALRRQLGAGHHQRHAVARPRARAD